VLPDLKQYKVQEEVIRTVRVTPAEVMDAFLAEKEKAKIGYLYVPYASLKDIVPEPTDEEALSYYENHKEDFKIGEQATASIVLFEKTPTENDWDRVYYLAKDIYDSALAGADFAELAQTYSEDNSASGGGDLGWFPRGRMVPEFDSAAWALDVDGISPPVRTRFGWHIIKVLGRKTEKEMVRGSDKPEMVEKLHAAHILLKVSPSQETTDPLFNDATAFREAAEAEGFDQAAERLGYEVKVTDPFTKNGFVRPIRSNDEMTAFVFNNKVGAISDVMENSSAYFVFAVKSRIPPGYTSFDVVKPSIIGQLAVSKAKQLAEDTAQVIYKDVSGGLSLPRASGKFGFPYQESDWITRKSVIPNIGSDPAVLGAAFALQNINDISLPIQYQRGTAIVELLDKSSPGLEQFNEVQDSVRVAVLQAKHQDVYNRWFDNMVNNAKIENFLDRFYKTY
jgi:peptidyl-prolyl cis-trans isomerase D